MRAARLGVVMQITAPSDDQLVARVGSALAENPQAQITAVVPAGLDEDKTIALCAALAALGVAGIEGVDETIARRCLDTAKVLRAGHLGAIGTKG